MTTQEKEERDNLVKKFQDKFEEYYKYRPTMRRTKSGGFMFDEGGENQIIICQASLAHDIHFFEDEIINFLDRK